MLHLEFVAEAALKKFRLQLQIEGGHSLPPCDRQENT